jgi:hypothetical protein
MPGCRCSSTRRQALADKGPDGPGLFVEVEGAPVLPNAFIDGRACDR